MRACRCAVIASAPNKNIVQRGIDFPLIEGRYYYAKKHETWGSSAFDLLCEEFKPSTFLWRMHAMRNTDVKLCQPVIFSFVSGNVVGDYILFSSLFLAGTWGCIFCGD